MKRTLITLIALGISSMAVAQEKPMNKGENGVYAYYGVSLLGGFYKSVASAAAVNLQTRNLGPVGIVYEHMVTDVVGIGAEMGYQQLIMTYFEPDVDPVSGTVNDYQVQWSFTTIRAMFRANFHFSDSRNFDAYALVSAGYRHTTYDIRYSSPYYRDQQSFSGFFPFGIKPGIGLKYFFTENIGLGAEIALGTPLFSGGLALRF